MFFPEGDWVLHAPEAVGMDGVALERAVEFLAQRAGRDGVNELVIARQGRMIWRGPQADKVHGVWSVTKSFTTTVLGLMVDDGLARLDQRAAEILPEMAACYPSVTLEHFASMTSGYRAVGDEPRGTYLHGPSLTPFVPGPPLFSPPGSKYAYWDSAMNQLGHLVTRIAGRPLREVFQQRIGDAIGLTPDAWAWGDFGEHEGVLVNGGSGNCDQHVRISALGLARLGHLFLNDGTWNGQRLISADWVHTATSVHVPAETPLGHPESGIDGRGVYGLGWWANGFQPDGRRLWPGHERRMFAATGHNNNKLLVVPAWDLVVARLGLDQADARMGDTLWGEFLQRFAQSLV